MALGVVNSISYPMRTLTNRRATSAVPKRCYNFGSSKYAKSFGNTDIPRPAPEYAAMALEHVKAFKPQVWYDEPIVTHLNGTKHTDGMMLRTTDATGTENGHIVISNPATVDRIIHHMKTFRPPQKDYRETIRDVEQVLLTEKYVGMLIGNQLLDFGKQDGCTEIMEAVEANTVERRFNDDLLSDEAAGIVTIRREPAIAGCVSNFSNFLDLFRKTIRCLEVGVPVVVFSRTNTTQHMYRWFVVLEKELAARGFPAGMLTFASLSVADQRRVMAANPGSPMNLTGSREVAALIKEVNPLLCASTGGPNTMLTTGWTPSIQQSVQLSATIESSGQCTAMRHLVAPVAAAEALTVFDGVEVFPSADVALAEGKFAGILQKLPFVLEAGYTKHPSLNVAVRGSPSLPPKDLDEHWRNVYLDVTTKRPEDMESDEFVDELSSWLVEHQPISFVVNHKTRKEAYALMERYFRRSSLCVYTIGTEEKPALTAQARPQVAEIFGEVPPRQELAKYTHFPVLVPSATASYNSVYAADYLKKLAGDETARALLKNHAALRGYGSTAEQGYINAIALHVKDSAVGARRGADPSSRTALWGLQRPPLGRKMVIRVDEKSNVGFAAAHLVPFAITNAAPDVRLSVHPNLRGLPLAQSSNAWEVVFEEETTVGADVWGVVNVPEKADFALGGQFVTKLLAFGHIKSVYSHDEEFVKTLSRSEKWLRAVE